MQNYATALKALSVAVASTCMLACSSGTSKSSSDQFTETQPETIKPTDVALVPVEINSSNYYEMASATLKAVLLTDTSSSVLGRSATISRDNTDILEAATGIIISLDPIPCNGGGSVQIEGEISNTDPNSDLLLNFENSLNWHFNTYFDSCVQVGSRLTGAVEVLFNTNINELLNSVQYTFKSTMIVNDLLMEESNMAPVMVKGTYDYEVRNLDGIHVNTIIFTEDTFYANDTDYQSLNYLLDKTVNNETQEYEFSISSTFSASFLDSAFVEYETLTPLRGTGFSYPNSGQIAVRGVDSTIYITSMANEVVFLELDLGSDGSIDESDYSTWGDLVIDPSVQPDL